MVYDTTKTGFMVFILALYGKVDGVGCCVFAVNTACDKVVPCSFCHVPLFATIELVSKRGFLMGYLGLLRYQNRMVRTLFIAGVCKDRFHILKELGLLVPCLTLDEKAPFGAGVIAVPIC